ncbi:phage tail tape measure protein [Chryseobacterium cucumeris]|uniref:phage tail tape measure protein n=1 Tax=Chryseobacterium cucumeris TaxID=1813611 RepID=UPI0037C158AA
MSNTIEYILNLRDNITDRITRISGASTNATNTMQRLERQTRNNERAFNNANRSITGFRKVLKDVVSAIPGGEFITNPYVMATGALVAAGTAAVKVDEGMAAINTTAQLTQPQLQQLKDDLLDVGLKGGANLYKIPEAYEKIISQTGDVALSQDILEQSIKGSKAGFTDQAVVADALAQSLSLVGKENTNAQEVLDTFFAAKRVGAGEFKDFAQYMPNLIASGQALGVTFKNTAGLFAYMTGKGFSAEKSATLLENAYTALGKSDIQKGLKKAGVNVFDKDGSLKSMDIVFGELGKKLSKMSDNKKSNFLESIGLRDAQAKSAFMALTADSDKLKESLNATNKAAGETDKAFANAQNPMMKIQLLWSKIQYASIKLGDVIGKVLSPALDGLNFLFDTAFSVASNYINMLREGDAGMWAWTVVVGALAIGYGALALWEGIVTVATLAWEGAQWLLNAALTANPVGLIIAGIVVLIALIGYVIYKTDGWGNAWKHTVNGAKLLWQTYVSYIKASWETLVSGLMIGINKIQIGWYKFKNTMGFGDENANNAMISKLNDDTEKRKEAIKKSWTDVAKNGAASASEFVKAGQSLKWNSDRSLGDLVGGLKKKIGMPAGDGITPPKRPGALDNSALPDDDKDKKDKSKTNEAIATGGQRHNYITINLKDLIGVLNITGKDFKDSTNQMTQQTEDALVRVLAMATTAGV